MIRIVNVLFQRFADLFPGIRIKLKQAGLSDSPEDFIKKTLFASFYLTTGMMIVMVAVVLKMGSGIGIVLMASPLLLIGIFLSMMNVPDVQINRKRREIDSELIFLGRFLIIQLDAGIPAYNAMKNISRHYRVAGKYFQEIIDRVDLGTPIEDAINESIMYSPSPNFVRVLWQILNSLKTGSDITISLGNVLDQITKEQLIEIKEYGKKLNPMAMLYMVIAIIMPTLGVTIFIVLSTFFSLNITLTWLLMIVGFIAFMQFMFYTMIKSARPAVQL